MLAAALALTNGCVDPPDTIGNSFAVALAGGEWVEAELIMAAGDTVDVRFDSGEIELSWNVHSHVAETAVDHLVGVGAHGTIRFEAPQSRLYWVMWTNFTESDAVLDVDFELGGSTAFNGWYP